ncbi:MAG: hypothetical protein KDF54_15055 [Hydrogenophaga sp.]|nr:hypothetical protein [Hydrogenophaga sp.]
MLIQLLTQHPEALVDIVSRTPHWVWGLFAGLLLLGITQLRDRRLGLRRALLPTLGLTAFALFSLGKDLAPTPWLASGLLVWLTAAATVLALVARRAPRPGTAYDPASGRFSVPGSVMPLLTILAIFLLKYTLGIELAMQPALRFEASFALAMAAGYGAPSLACSPADRWVCGA